MWKRGQMQGPDRGSTQEGVSQSSSGQPPSSPGQHQSLRAEQVAQTRAALVASARRLFGHRGFAGTSVEDVAREARVTTGALYHHFSTKTLLFEAAFEQTHAELMAASAPEAEEAREADGVVGLFSRGFDLFLDAVLRPDFQQIIVVDGPAVLGLARFTELDERDAFPVMVAALESATATGELHVEDPETVARLLLGAMTRGAMLIASSPEPGKTRQAVADALLALLNGFSTSPGP
jgi:AcrR family transcriptional regulator